LNFLHFRVLGEGGTSRYDELEEINNPDFVSKSFRSSSDAKARKQKKAVEIEDINELHIAPQPPPDISVTSLEEKKKRTHLHENVSYVCPISLSVVPLS
jgi:hypothetical protein